MHEPQTLEVITITRTYIHPLCLLLSSLEVQAFPEHLLVIFCKCTFSTSQNWWKGNWHKHNTHVSMVSHKLLYWYKHSACCVSRNNTKTRHQVQQKQIHHGQLLISPLFSWWEVKLWLNEEGFCQADWKITISLPRRHVYSAVYIGLK